MSTNLVMTQSKSKMEFLLIFLFLDLKSEGQAQLVEAKMDLSDESSAGTNNK